MFELWHSTLNTRISTLPLQADAEAEDLGVVGVGFRYGEGKVERNRGRAHGWNGDSQADAGGHAEIGERDVLIDRAEIDKGHAVDHVVGGEREQVFNRVEELEVAAD